MAGKTPIEWAERTWNPIVGCSIVSPGCTNCYAMKMAARIERMAGDPHSSDSYRRAGRSHYDGTTRPSKAGAVWTGKVALAPESVLLAPLRRRKPTTWFVNSMGDLFHESVPDEWIDRVIAVMALAPQHTFQVLTKRSARMRAYMANLFTPARIASDGLAEATIGFPTRQALVFTATWPLPNVWLGVSAEDQRRADERVPDLLATPAAVRFVSAEPLLGPIDFTRWGMQDGPEFGLDWIIVGGESGPGARPMHPDWAQSIRDQCAAAGVPFFFKQWGEWAPALHDADDDGRVLRQIEKVGAFDSWNARVYDLDRTEGVNWRLLGKKRAGRLLDGVEHNAMPEHAA